MRLVLKIIIVSIQEKQIASIHSFHLQYKLGLACPECFEQFKQSIDFKQN